MEVRRPNGQDGSDQQRAKNNQVAANVFTDVVMSMIFAHNF
jgi:hypothetical protein